MSKPREFWVLMSNKGSDFQSVMDMNWASYPKKTVFNARYENDEIIKVREILPRKKRLTRKKDKK